MNLIHLSYEERMEPLGRHHLDTLALVACPAVYSSLLVSQGKADEKASFHGGCSERARDGA